MAKFTIPVCLLLLALVHTGYALKCYSCDSKMKSECSDPAAKDKLPLNECPSSAVGMESTCLKFVTEENNDMKTKRYCMIYPKGSMPCDYAASLLKTGKVKECDSCNEDGCNAAGFTSASTYAIVATSILALFNVFARV